MKTNNGIDQEILSDPQKIDALQQEAWSFLEQLDSHWVEILSGRSDKVLSAEKLEQFFRSKERNEQVGRTLQYLLVFLTHLPRAAETESTPVNPAEQFREFIRYQVELLLEEDVKKAVFREINRLGSLNESNVWDYQERLFATYRNLREQVSKNNGGTTQAIASLCQVLEQLSLFWLEIKHGDSCRTRRSDIYMYSLSRIVKYRCQLSGEA
ncbi:MAG TPA: hypothetical protein VLQ89_01020 [Candidatus Binatia bacterium]|nr:hypothetical protein [Candidatus Binatia bacterium]